MRKWVNIFEILIFIFSMTLAFGILNEILHYSVLLPPSSDDFSTMRDTISFGGPLSRALHFYQTWSGRLVTTYLANLTFFDYGVFRWLSTALGFLYIASMFFLISFFAQAALQNKYWYSSLSIVSICCLIGLYWLYPQCVFWASGGMVYTIPVALLTVFLYLLKAKFPPLPLTLLFVFVLSALAGNALEQTSAVGLTAIVLMFKDYFKSKTFQIAATGFIVGTVLLIIAPGNYVRALHGTRSFSTFNIFDLLQNFSVLVEKGMPLFFIPAIEVGIVCGLCIFPLLPHRNTLQNIRQALLCLILSVASAAPITLIPDFIDTRIFFIPTIFLFLSAVLMAISFGQFVLKYKVPTWVNIIWVITGFYIVQYYYWGEFQSRYDIATKQSTEIQQRREYILKARTDHQLDLVVSPYKYHTGFYHQDITADPDFWVNQTVAHYYKLNSIRLRPSEE